MNTQPPIPGLPSGSGMVSAAGVISAVRQLATRGQRRQRGLRGGALQSLAGLSVTNGNLPAIDNGAEFLAADSDQPEEVISGIAHKGGKLSLGGGSKSYKTWTLLQLALAVADGKEWLGWPCRAGRVLYSNFEIQKHFLRARLLQLEEG